MAVILIDVVEVAVAFMILLRSRPFAWGLCVTRCLKNLESFSRASQAHASHIFAREESLGARCVSRRIGRRPDTEAPLFAASLAAAALFAVLKEHLIYVCDINLYS